MSEQVGPTHRITLGDTLLPLNVVLRDGNGDPYNLASYTVEFAMETETGTEDLAQTSTGVTKHPTQNFTVDTTANLVKCNAHGVQLHDQIVVSTSGTLPAGLAASTRYHARDITPNSFKLAAGPEGEVIDITDTGTGTHSFFVVGSAQMDFASTNVDTAGRYRGWFVLVSATENHHVPHGDQHIGIEIVARGN